ncbi:hypothetical protein FACS1894147_00910 [Spirochaetia bacterium]|nr:hypothetical protein FACS1894147_00910 [Spirochaetia bacterium]
MLYYRVYKPVLAELGIDAALYYGYLLNQKEYREKQSRKKINDIKFFVVRNHIKTSIGLSRIQQVAAEMLLVTNDYITIIPKSYEGNHVKFNPQKMGLLNDENFICVYQTLLAVVGYNAAVLYGILDDYRKMTSKQSGNHAVRIPRETLTVYFKFESRTRKKYEELLISNSLLEVINNKDRGTITYKVIGLDDAHKSTSGKTEISKKLTPLPPTNNKSCCVSIVKKYNHIMGIKTFSDRDVDNCMAHYEKIEQIEPVIDDFLLPYIWENLSDAGTREKVKSANRRISAFISFGLLDDCVKNIDSLMSIKDDLLLDELQQIYNENFDEFERSKPRYILSLFNGSIYITDYSDEYDYPEYCYIKRMANTHNDIGIVWYVMNKSIGTFPAEIQTRLQKVECPKRYVMNFDSTNDAEYQGLNGYTINCLWETYAPNIQDRRKDNFIRLHLIDVAIMDKDTLYRKLLDHIRNELFSLIDFETLKVNLPDYLDFSDNQLSLSSTLEKDSPLGKKLIPLWLDFSTVEWEIAVFYHVLEKASLEKLTQNGIGNYREYIPVEISAMI